MLGWLRALFGRTPDPGAVFRYSDGTATVGADPLRLKAALDAALPDWAERCGKLAECERVLGARLRLPGNLGAELVARRERIIGELVAAARSAFGLAPYAERNGRASGVTDLAALDVLGAFLGWVAELMEQTRPLATAPPPSASPASASPTDSGPASPSTPDVSPATASGESPGPSDEPSAATASTDGP